MQRFLIANTPLAEGVAAEQSDKYSGVPSLWSSAESQRPPFCPPFRTRSAIAFAIMSAVANGQRDPEQLKAAGVRALMGQNFPKGGLSLL
jgi:hypothetical protein